MIVGTHFGLFMPALRPDHEKLPIGEPELQVRSRRRIDLLNLRRYMTDNGLVIGEVFTLPNTDYQYRAYCTREAWGQALSMLAQTIDYTKFKDTPQKYHGDTKLTDAYGRIWNATLSSFPTGSVYDYSHRTARHQPRQKGKTQQQRVAETVFRTETKEWRMAGASAAELRDLMREIDAATDGVQLPTEQDTQEMLSLELNDHSNCTHGVSKSAKRRCRDKRLGR